jgi:hypothetical protein
MSLNYGTGVSRVLDPAGTQYTEVIWQQGKPPLDSEINLLQDLAKEQNRILVARGVPSGFFANDINTDFDYITNPVWSNWFRFGQQKSGETQTIPWVVVNSWLIPVTGTQTGTPPGSPNNTDTWNRVTLTPPPSSSGDSRVDFVFLEAWLARVPPNPSTLNKPAAASIYRYGNVEGGYSFLADDLVDPAIGFETSQRVQVQYRIRVVSGLVGLASYPDGFDPSVVKAQGAATATTSFTFTNMRQALGDPGLWRAGDGTANSLGTVDGYTYAIPLCAVFRRNLVAWDGDPSQNLNGGFNRNPTALDRTGWKTFSTTPTLAAGISDAVLSLTLSSASNIPLPTSPATPVYIQIGDEILSYSSITGTTMTITARAQFGTKAEAHYTGDTIRVLSGRPDGLYSDQIAKTDILDLRHAVNPNGFDYTALLHQSFDKLLQGQLRSNWKYSGGGPQGSFVFYEDKIGTSAALGVTKLDAPDGIRMVFSDAAMLQKVEVVTKASTVTVPPSGPQSVGTAWGLGLGVICTACGTAGSFSPGDVFEIDITQFKNTFPGGDGDQIHFVNDGFPNAVEMRIDGYPYPLVQGTHFSVSPANPTDTDDLVITLLPDFPPTDDEGETRPLFITVAVQYGGGRGLSRRPDSIHSVSFLSPGTPLLTQLAGQPLNNIPMRVSWAPLWSKYRSSTLRSLLPSTAEAYADLGSKSVFLTPFRQIDLPDKIWAYDGTNINANTGAPIVSSTTGSSTGTTTFTDLSGNFILSGVVVGDTLIISSSPGAGTYKVIAAVAATTFTADRVIPADATITYTICHSQGLMPLNSLSGAVKWTTTDPLILFSGTTYGSAQRKNIFVTFPRHLIPGWGEVKVPILYDSSPGGTFDRGINYMILSKEGGSPPAKEKNYVPYSNGTLSYAPFSTVDLNLLTPATYNASFVYNTNKFAGMRKFTDTRGLGRQGLELPPFYGVARLFGVYEAGDYKLNASPFNVSTRALPGGTGTAANLLRQNFDGATFWIELDADGDSTFILNADAIDIKKSLVNPIANFAAGNYVIEASIFGFDRGTFDLDQQPRIVLTRERADSEAGDPAVRTNNYKVQWDGSTTAGTSSGILAPDLVVPGPLPSGEEVGITFSRQPYQGDAWGSQTVYQDTGYAAGPLTSGTMYQLASTTLDQSALTRPNQKPLEVLASLRFTTTLGTGRLSGDYVSSGIVDFRNVGYEDFAVFPPTSGIDPRPRVIPGAKLSSEIGTGYLGLTDRLPLGATFRDKDFRGERCGDTRKAFQYHGEVSTGSFLVSQSVNKSLEQDEINLSTSSVGSGAPGDIVVQVDGEPGNYAVLTNFRTNRGGSMFLGSGSHPGGEITQTFETFTPGTTPLNVLGGLALLVRNQVTSVGATEVSAGDELMMVIVTTGYRSTDPSLSLSHVIISTAGTAEGFSASDLYRVQGHPLLRDNEKTEVDPNAFDLSLALSFY